jgi:hypothetical protein
VKRKSYHGPESPAIFELLSRPIEIFPLKLSKSDQRLTSTKIIPQSAADNLSRSDGRFLNTHAKKQTMTASAVAIAVQETYDATFDDHHLRNCDRNLACDARMRP